ncbi:MAG TPA: hypothetical protein VL588_07490, partial [Bdellovibrionota bacterium]|nr:hypothetical protein [Bdellovibrionota bacterium]
MRSWLFLYLFAALTTSSLFACISRSGALPPVLVVLAVAGLWAVRPHLAKESSPSVRRPRLDPASLGIGFLVAAPVICLLIMTWNQEFPFVGDHDYHLIRMHNAYDFWGRYWWMALGGALVLWRARKSRWLPGATLAVLFIFMAWARTHSTGAELRFAIRYPGNSYFFALPIYFIARVAHWDAPLNALRLSHALSILAWLFFLRPRFVGKKPDLSVLPFAFFFFFQKDFVYYFTTSYLEPWAAVLILTAAERLLVLGSRESWKTFLLVGLAAVTKEQAILIFPFVFLAAYPWRGPRAERLRTWFAGLTAVFPFVMYFIARKFAGIWRTAGLAAAKDIFNLPRVKTFAGFMLLQFGPAGIFVFAGILACGVYTAWKSPKYRRATIALMAAGLFQEVFFYTDRISIDWTGYPRFRLLASILMAAPL